ncbi:MAG: single-stranded-DNA-specific exonuclease RecJ [Chloroflexi bacterium]|nr:single-stranded-DNA-specific exonuclease RecJ [Chloroflexota bacterium]
MLRYRPLYQEARVSNPAPASAAATPSRAARIRAKRWAIYPTAPDDQFARFPDLPPVVVQILYNRGLTDPAAVTAFIQPDRPTPSDDLFRMAGMTRAVDRIRQAIHAREPIAIYGDYDVDGVTATSLLLQTLTAFGADVRPYIPHRVDEGYGLNIEALEMLKKDGVRLVITVDCGTRSLAEVAHAKTIGLDLIISDHHMPSDQLPDAYALINPKQPACPYPFKELAGVGLAFKIAQALLIVNRRDDAQKVTLQEDDLLELVALGTVADLAPLLDENRSLVARGLRQLKATTRPGLRALINLSRASIIDTTTIGFALGPRLNAAGRLDHALNAYHILMTADAAEADRLALDLDSRNRDRQTLTRELSDKARELILSRADGAALLFAADPDFKSGVVGLVASRLTEEFYRPSVVVEQGPIESRGSCRSIPEFHITRALDECGDLFVRHGGHAAAAGFTIETARLAKLSTRLEAIAQRELGGQELMPTLSIDAVVPLHKLKADLFSALQQLEPHGYANPQPIFASKHVSLMEIRTVGADAGHLKLRVSDGSVIFDAIAFRFGPLVTRFSRGDKIDLAYTFEENEWNGEKRFQLNVKDIKLAA